MELRIMIELTQDKLGIREYSKGKEADLHTLTAALIKGLSVEKFNQLPEKERKLARQQAKAVNFGLAYCMGAMKFMYYAKENYGVNLSLNEAKKFRATYLSSYKGIQKLHERLKTISETCTERRTLAGRIIRWESPPGISALANAPVQALNADITKLALANLYKKIRKLGVGSLVNVVHDEIIMEFPESFDKEQAANLLSGEMEEAGRQYVKSVPVYADAGIGTSWADK